MVVCINRYICMPTWIRHGLNGATKPTFVAKSLHELLLLSLSCVTRHSADLVREVVGTKHYTPLHIDMYI